MTRKGVIIIGVLLALFLVLSQFSPSAPEPTLAEIEAARLDAEAAQFDAMRDVRIRAEQSERRYVVMWLKGNGYLPPDFDPATIPPGFWDQDEREPATIPAASR